MKGKGCSPDGKTYNALIELLTIRHMPEEAVRAYNAMVRAVGGGLQVLGGDAGSMDESPPPPQLDYNRSAADFSRAGKPDVLAELARKMKFSVKFEAANVLSR
ncbi:hypothetical protein MLD38_026354 [Melastoma candidum]|uniref:Uncharacterized protein n=1 Tax=Melastoma candidum TaxID=119954 RepID=A0ACB9NZP2_9MYRT|nr:hypothetical protein MLD38_026354 [Melastoma candidum]